MLMPEPYYPRVYVYRRIVQAKLFMDRNYQRKIDLDKIAGEACFSKYHFIRLFKSVYTITPYQYLITLRVNAARALLKTGRFTITDACFEVGFESVSTFSGLFKRISGETPGAFLRAAERERRAVLNRPRGFVPHCFVRNLPA